MEADYANTEPKKYWQIDGEQTVDTLEREKKLTNNISAAKQYNFRYTKTIDNIDYLGWLGNTFCFNLLLIVIPIYINEILIRLG